MPLGRQWLIAYHMGARVRDHGPRVRTREPLNTQRVARLAKREALSPFLILPIDE